MYKIVFATVIIMLIACSAIKNAAMDHAENVLIKDIAVKVCVNYNSRSEACGTGFFVSKNTMITARHVVDLSNDGIVTIVADNTIVQTADATKSENADVATVKIPDMVTHYYIEKCDNASIGTAVDLIFEPGLKYIDGHAPGVIVEVEKDTGIIVIAGIKIQKGNSGSPVVDIVNGCAMGVVVGTMEGESKFIVAYDITK